MLQIDRGQDGTIRIRAVELADSERQARWQIFQRTAARLLDEWERGRS